MNLNIKIKNWTVEAVLGNETVYYNDTNALKTTQEKIDGHIENLRNALVKRKAYVTKVNYDMEECNSPWEFALLGAIMTMFPVEIRQYVKFKEKEHTVPSIREINKVFKR